MFTSCVKPSVLIVLIQHFISSSSTSKHIKNAPCRPPEGVPDYHFPFSFTILTQYSFVHFYADDPVLRASGISTAQALNHL